MRRFAFPALLIVVLAAVLTAQDVKLPMKADSLYFGVLGDTGTGSSDQVAVAKQLTTFRGRVPFDFVIMLGDNIYGSDAPKDFVKKFEVPYKSLLDAGVKFYAALGNHDDPAGQQNYKPFNMAGARYYSFRPKLGVRFFALDSNYMDQKQLDWLDKELAASGSDWKVAFFHHPPYASGMHGSSAELREHLEPLFVKYGVNVVFNGHEHFYERIKPQKGIQYFVMGNSAKLRRGDIRPSSITAKGFDNGYAFMLVEIAGSDMHFQVISSTGTTVDSGVIQQLQLTTPAGNDRSVVTTTGVSDKK